MENKHNQAVTIFLVVVIVLLVAAVGVLAYFLISSNNKTNGEVSNATTNQSAVEQSTNKTNTNTNNEVNIPKVENNTQNTQTSESVKSTNDSGSRVFIDYTRALNGDFTSNSVIRKFEQFGGLGIYAYLKDTNTVSFNYTPNKLITSYNLKNVEASDSVKTAVIKLENRKVVDIYITGWGQANGAETLFFLLDDGTVEYMPIRNAIQNNRFESYGKIDSVKDVVKISNYSVNLTTGGGYVDAFAITSEGKFYSLSKILDATGYYKW